MSLRTAILLMTLLLAFATTGYSKNMDLGNLVTCARFAKSDDFYLPERSVLIVRGSKKLIVFNESFVHEIPIPAKPSALDLSFTPYFDNGKNVTGVRLYLEEGRMISPPKAVLSDGTVVHTRSLQHFGGYTLMGSNLKAAEIEKLPKIGKSQLGENYFSRKGLSTDAITEYERIGSGPKYGFPDPNRDRYFTKSDIADLQTCQKSANKLQLFQSEKYFKILYDKAKLDEEVLASAVKDVKIEIQELPIDSQKHTQSYVQKAKTTRKTAIPKKSGVVDLTFYNKSPKYRFAKYHLVKVVITNSSNEEIPVPNVWPCASIDDVIKVLKPFTRIPPAFGAGGSCASQKATFHLKQGQEEMEVLLGSKNGGNLVVELATEPKITSEPFPLK